MSNTAHNYTQLPRKLLAELELSQSVDGKSVNQRSRRPARKDIRKEARAEKKSRQIPGKKSGQGRENQSLETRNQNGSKSIVDQLIQKPSAHLTKPSNLVPKLAETQSIASPPESPPPKLSKKARKQLADEDAAIANLEGKLGLNKKSKLPKTFENDGLDFLLEELEGAEDSESALLGKRKRSEDKKWLEQKRGKLDYSELGINAGKNKDGQPHIAGDEEDASVSSDESAEWASLKSDLGSESDESEISSDSKSQKRPQKTRENPYVAPVVESNIAHGKYVPPSLRKFDDTSTTDLSRLRRQVKGLFNRLSEANLVSIALEVEKLYQSQPRHHVSLVMIETLTDIISDPAYLQDTFIILHSAFVTALYKILGTDFGAQALDKFYKEFSQLYGNLKGKDGGTSDLNDKKLVNLVQLFAEIYNFQLIASNMIYDLIRLLLNTFSESNTELLLKLIRNCGTQLRQDDPSSLKDISLLLQERVAQIGQNNVSVRTKFMIEAIDDLKRNNRNKSHAAVSAISADHRTTMKRTLGTLNQRSIRASEPLRVGIQDLEEVDKRGKWWLVGSSFRNENVNTPPQANTSIHDNEHDGIDDQTSIGDTTQDLAQLARDQRMNTDVRRSIFIATLSSSDFNDAYVRLKKLRLKKSQELEIPKVLIHCASTEATHNPFYTLLARRFCSDHKLRMTFQFVLWDLFKQMGEGGDESVKDDDDENEEQRLSLRSLVNLGKLYGGLIADEALSLSVLKNLNLAYLQPKTKTFLEILLVTVILQSQKGRQKERRERALQNLVVKPKEMPEMARGLQYFLKTVVRKTDLASDKIERETVRRGCKIVDKALSRLAISEL